MIGEISSLHPVFKSAVKAILHDLETKGWHPVIASGMRTKEQQDALYAQGRKSLDEVNALRLRAKLMPIKAAQNNRVTNAKGGQSNHNLTQSYVASSSSQSAVSSSRSAVEVAYGYAVDIVDVRYGWDTAPPRFWQDLGDSAKEHGCSWGGDWKKPDVAHVEMKLIDGASWSSVVV